MVQSFFFFHKFFQPSSKLCPSRGQKQVSRWRSFRKYLQGEKVCVVLWKSWSYVQTSHWRPAITSYGYIGKRKPKNFMCLYEGKFLLYSIHKSKQGKRHSFSEKYMEILRGRPEVAELRRLFSMRDIVELDYSVCRTSWSQTIQHAGHRGAVGRRQLIWSFQSPTNEINLLNAI